MTMMPFGFVTPCLLSRLGKTTLTAAAVLFTVATNCRATAPPKFTDDFSDGSVTDGSPVSWSALGVSSTVQNQDLRLSGSGGGGTSLVNGSEQFGDVSIRTTVRADVRTIGSSNPFHFLGPIARSNSAGDSFYWGGISTLGDISVGTWEPFNQSNVVHMSFNPVTTDVDLKFQVIGQTMSLWAWSDQAGVPKSEEPQVVWQTTRGVESGAVGLGYNPNGGQGQMIVRSFSVVPEPGTGRLAKLGCWAMLGAIRRRPAIRI